MGEAARRAVKKPLKPDAGHGKAPPRPSPLPLTDAASVDDKIEIVEIDVTKKTLPNVRAMFANAGSIAPIMGSNMARLTLYETFDNGAVIEGVCGVVMHRADMLRIADMIIANTPREPPPNAAAQSAETQKN